MSVMVVECVLFSMAAEQYTFCIVSRYDINDILRNEEASIILIDCASVAESKEYETTPCSNLGQYLIKAIYYISPVLWWLKIRQSQHR
jgi:hypothetical protein